MGFGDPGRWSRSFQVAKRISGKVGSKAKTSYFWTHTFLLEVNLQYPQFSCSVTSDSLQLHGQQQENHKHPVIPSALLPSATPLWKVSKENDLLTHKASFWTVVLEKTLENPWDCKEIQPVHPKGNHPWVFTGRTDVEAETPIFWLPDTKSWLIWKDRDAGKRLKVGGEGDDRGWYGWMALPTRWTRVWVNSGSWWWTGRPGRLQSLGSQKVGYDWATELNWKQVFMEGLLNTGQLARCLGLRDL